MNHESGIANLNSSNHLLNPDNAFPLEVQFFQDAIGIAGIHFSSWY